MLSGKNKNKVQNKGYIFYLRKRRMDFFFFGICIYKKLIKVFPHGVWGEKGMEGWGAELEARHLTVYIFRYF